MYALLLVLVLFARGGGGGGRGGGFGGGRGGGPRSGGVRAGLRSLRGRSLIRGGRWHKNFGGRNVGTKLRQEQKAINSARGAKDKLEAFKAQSQQAGFKRLLTKSQDHVEDGMRRMYIDKHDARSTARHVRKRVDNEWDGNTNDLLYKMLERLYQEVEDGDSLFDEVFVELE